MSHGLIPPDILCIAECSQVGVFVSAFFALWSYWLVGDSENLQLDSL
jgi:hypothetical protein